MQLSENIFQGRDDSSQNMHPDIIYGITCYILSNAAPVGVFALYNSTNTLHIEIHAAYGKFMIRQGIIYHLEGDKFIPIQKNRQPIGLTTTKYEEDLLYFSKSEIIAFARLLDSAR